MAVGNAPDLATLQLRLQRMGTAKTSMSRTLLQLFIPIVLGADPAPDHKAKSIWMMEVPTLWTAGERLKPLPSHAKTTAGTAQMI